MTDTVTLIIAGSESTIPAEEMTIERIIAEARSMGYEEFSVFCNDTEISKPEDFKLITGATYVIASPDDAIDPNNIVYSTEDGENDAD